jgi:hypothetical protein
MAFTPAAKSSSIVSIELEATTIQEGELGRTSASQGGPQFEASIGKSYNDG